MSAPFLRGTGAGERSADGRAMSKQADDMRGLLTALGLPGPPQRT
ncbi:hypothetical protein [Acrocarpospora macrocephala]|nr:hypothetical protein [Acrocarpospora macrocephala]